MAAKSLDKKVPETPEQKEMRELKKQVADLKKIVQSTTANQMPIQYIQQPDNGIPLNKQVKVMSLCPNKLNLSTEKGGKGHHYGFERFGETKKISYGDIVAIGENHRNFKEAGFYIILDDAIVEEEGLTDTYAKILNKEKIERILANEEDAMTLFQSANPKQQKIVVDMIVAKLVAGEYVDQNLVNAIDRFNNPKGDKNISGIADRFRTVEEIKNFEE